MVEKPEDIPFELRDAVLFRDEAVGMTIVQDKVG